MLALLFEGQQRMGNIATYMGCILSSATNPPRRVDRLVDKGLVIRSIDPEDRRAVVCHLTVLGKVTMESFWSIGHEKIITLAHHLEATELADVVRAPLLIYHAASFAAPLGCSQPHQ